MKARKIPLGECVSEVRDRLGDGQRTIYSVTNDRGFISSLEVFDKQVFSADTSNYKAVRHRDLAYNPSRINVGSVALCPDRKGGAVSPMYVIVRCREDLLPEYLLHFLKSPLGLAEINARCEGSVRFQLKFKDLQRIPIFIPVRTEQERIVRILDEADVLRQRRTHADHRTAEFIPALFDRMFGDPLSNPRHWPTKELRALGRVVTGSTPPSAKEGMFGGMIPFITPGDLNNNTRETMRYVTKEGAAEARTVRAGSTLVCCIGATIGKTDRAWKLSAFNQQINAIEWAEQIDDDYGVVCMKQCSSTVIRQGSSTALPILKKSLFERIQIPVPPVRLQREFAERVAEVRALATAQAQSRQRLDALFTSLLDGAFKGEL